MYVKDDDSPLTGDLASAACVFTSCESVPGNRNRDGLHCKDYRSGERDVVSDSDGGGVQSSREDDVSAAVVAVQTPASRNSNSCSDVVDKSSYSSNTAASEQVVHRKSNAPHSESNASPESVVLPLLAHSQILSCCSLPDFFCHGLQCTLAHLHSHDPACNDGCEYDGNPDQRDNRQTYTNDHAVASIAPSSSSSPSCQAPCGALDPIMKDRDGLASPSQTISGATLQAMVERAIDACYVCEDVTIAAVRQECRQTHPPLRAESSSSRHAYNPMYTQNEEQTPCRPSTAHKQQDSPPHTQKTQEQPSVEEDGGTTGMAVVSAAASLTQKSIGTPGSTKPGDALWLSRQLQCAVYRQHLRAPRVAARAHFEALCRASDAQRMRGRARQRSCLAEDVLNYAAYMVALRSIHRDAGKDVTSSLVSLEPASSLFVSQSRPHAPSSPVPRVSQQGGRLLRDKEGEPGAFCSGALSAGFTKYGHRSALLYSRYPPPLLRDCSFTHQTVRLLRWLHTWLNHTDRRSSVDAHIKGCGRMRSRGHRSSHGKKRQKKQTARVSRAAAAQDDDLSKPAPLSEQHATNQDAQDDGRGANDSTNNNSHIDTNAHKQSPCSVRTRDANICVAAAFRAAWLMCAKSDRWLLRTRAAATDKCSTQKNTRREEENNHTESIQAQKLQDNVQQEDRDDSTHTRSSGNDKRKKFCKDDTKPRSPYAPPVDKRRGAALPFIDELQRESVLLGSTPEVYVDQHGNRLRSARLAMKEAEQREECDRRQRRLSRKRGYFSRIGSGSDTDSHSNIYSENEDSNVEDDSDAKSSKRDCGRMDEKRRRGRRGACYRTVSSLCVAHSSSRSTSRSSSEKTSCSQIHSSRRRRWRSDSDTDCTSSSSLSSGGSSSPSSSTSSSADEDDEGSRAWSGAAGREDAPKRHCTRSPMPSTLPARKTKNLPGLTRGTASYSTQTTRSSRHPHARANTTRAATTCSATSKPSSAKTSSKSKTAPSAFARDKGTSDGVDEVTTNIAVVHGATGVGKTASVYLAASLLNFRVMEMNASVQRCPKSLERFAAELTRSHHISAGLTRSDGAEGTDRLPRAQGDVEAALREFKSAMASMSSSQQRRRQQQQHSATKQSKTQKQQQQQEDGNRRKAKGSRGGVSHSVTAECAAASRSAVRRKSNAISLQAVTDFFAAPRCVVVVEDQEDDTRKSVTESTAWTKHSSTSHAYANSSMDMNVVQKHAEDGSSADAKSGNCASTESSVPAAEIDSVGPVGLLSPREQDYLLHSNTNNNNTHPNSSDNVRNSDSNGEDDSDTAGQAKSKRSDYCPQGHTLLLLEDADVMLGDEMSRPLYAALRDLARTSNIPMIVTVSAPAHPHYRYSYSLGETMQDSSTTRDNDDGINDFCYCEGDQSRGVSSFWHSSHALVRRSDTALHIPFSPVTTAQYFGSETPFARIAAPSRVALYAQLLMVAAVESGLLHFAKSEAGAAAATSASAFPVASATAVKRLRGRGGVNPLDMYRDQLHLASAEDFVRLADRLRAEMYPASRCHVNRDGRKNESNSESTQNNNSRISSSCAALTAAAINTDARFWLNRLQLLLLDAPQREKRPTAWSATSHIDELAQKEKGTTARVQDTSAREATLALLYGDFDRTRGNGRSRHSHHRVCTCGSYTCYCYSDNRTNDKSNNSQSCNRYGQVCATASVWDVWFGRYCRVVVWNEHQRMRRERQMGFCVASVSDLYEEEPGELLWELHTLGIPAFLRALQRNNDGDANWGDEQEQHQQTSKQRRLLGETTTHRSAAAAAAAAYRTAASTVGSFHARIIQDEVRNIQPDNAVVVDTESTISATGTVVAAFAKECSPNVSEVVCDEEGGVGDSHSRNGAHATACAEVKQLVSCSPRSGCAKHGQTVLSLEGSETAHRPRGLLSSTQHVPLPLLSAPTDFPSCPSSNSSTPRNSLGLAPTTKSSHVHVSVSNSCDFIPQSVELLLPYGTVQQYYALAFASSSRLPLLPFLASSAYSSLSSSLNLTQMHRRTSTVSYSTTRCNVRGNKHVVGDNKNRNKSRHSSSPTRQYMSAMDMQRIRRLFFDTPSVTTGSRCDGANDTCTTSNVILRCVGSVGCAQLSAYRQSAPMLHAPTAVAAGRVASSSPSSLTGRNSRSSNNGNNSLRCYSSAVSQAHASTSPLLTSSASALPASKLSIHPPDDTCNVAMCSDCGLQDVFHEVHDVRCEGHVSMSQRVGELCGRWRRPGRAESIRVWAAACSSSGLEDLVGFTALLATLTQLPTTGGGGMT